MQKIVTHLMSLMLITHVSGLPATVVDIKNKAEFDQKIIAEKKSAVVKFTSQGCPPCEESIAPFQELSNEPGLSNIVFANVYLGGNVDLSDEYKIGGTPTFLYFRDGALVKEGPQFTGAQSFKEATRKAIAELLLSEAKPAKEAMKAPEAEKAAPTEVKTAPTATTSAATIFNDVWNWAKDTTNSVVSTVKGWIK
jgi:thiol-disulfide isomerase/thioredoxin